MFENVVVILRVMKKGRFSKSKRDLQHKSFVDSVLDSVVKYNTPQNKKIKRTGRQFRCTDLTLIRVIQINARQISQKPFVRLYVKETWQQIKKWNVGKQSMQYVPLIEYIWKHNDTEVSKTSSQPCKPAIPYMSSTLSVTSTVNLSAIQVCLKEILPGGWHYATYPIGFNTVKLMSFI